MKCSRRCLRATARPRSKRGGRNRPIELADLHQVDLIVFDAESDRTAAGTGVDDLKAAASRNGTPIVILGTVRSAKKRPPSGQFVAKPYHYGQLINKIEDLLDAA